MKQLLMWMGGAALLAACGAQTPVSSTQQTSMGQQGYTLCASQYVPSGSVVTSFYYSYGCATPNAGFQKNTYTVENLSGKSTFNGACSMTLPPSGWVITNFSYTQGCTANNGSFQKNTYNLANTAGQTQLNNVCNISSLPWGWTVTSRYYTSGCATENSGYTNNTFNIRKM